MTTKYIDPCEGCAFNTEECLLAQRKCHFKRKAEEREYQRQEKEKKERIPPINF